MTRHLGPDEFTAALEASPEGAVAAHLASCATCRDELAALQASWDALAAVEVPDPSPLFWDHFSARVRKATTETTPAAGPWWSTRRLVWGMGVTAAALILVVGLRWWPSVPPAADIVAGGTTTTEAVDAVAFDDVAGVFDAMDSEDVAAFEPAAATWAMVDELTDEERAAFVRLLEQQMEALP
jgi:hypothetical protein